MGMSRHQFLDCCRHLDAALAVQPLVTHAWYLKGISSMHLENWEDSLEAFTRCIQQEPDMGEAWANLGAIHMRNKNFPVARSTLEEALKHKSRNWKIAENLMLVNLAMRRFIF
jgi:Flp pilus assembly protein TadD